MQKHLTTAEISQHFKPLTSVRTQVSMKDFTTFKIGGPADILITPNSWDEAMKTKKAAKELNLPVFVLGGGSNLLVSDKGIRGVVLHIDSLRTHRWNGTVLQIDAGCEVPDTCEIARQNGMSGLEFIYGMPGSIGGAVWMNAQCYGKSISEILVSVDYIDEENQKRIYSFNSKDFSYKRSPFQEKSWIICSASFRLKPGDKNLIRKEMDAHKKDREDKGHYRFPCAGSVFKNNRAFGKPTGQLADEIGLKGFTIGGAKVADYHGNIIINTGNAAARDVLNMIEHIERDVFKHYGFKLEREVLLVGEW